MPISTSLSTFSKSTRNPRPRSPPLGAWPAGLEEACVRWKWISEQFTKFPAIDRNFEGILGIDSAAPTRLLTFPLPDRTLEEGKSLRRIGVSSAPSRRRVQRPGKDSVRWRKSWGFLHYRTLWSKRTPSEKRPYNTRVYVISQVEKSSRAPIEKPKAPLES